MQTGHFHQTSAPRLSIAPPTQSWKYKFFTDTPSQKFFTDTQKLKQVQHMRHELLAEEEELSPANRTTGADREVILKRKNGMHWTTLNTQPPRYKTQVATVTNHALEGEPFELEQKSKTYHSMANAAAFGTGEPKAPPMEFSPLSGPQGPAQLGGNWALDQAAPQMAFNQLGKISKHMSMFDMTVQERAELARYRPPPRNATTSSEAEEFSLHQHVGAAQPLSPVNRAISRGLRADGTMLRTRLGTPETRASSSAMKHASREQYELQTRGGFRGTYVNTDIDNAIPDPSSGEEAGRSFAGASSRLQEIRKREAGDASVGDPQKGGGGLFFAGGCVGRLLVGRMVGAMIVDNLFLAPLRGG